LPAGLQPIYIPVAPPIATPARPGDPPPPKRSLEYRAGLAGFANVTFVDKKRGLEFQRTYRRVAEAPTIESPASWSAAIDLPDELADGPETDAQWTEVPESINAVKKIKTLQKSFVDFLYVSARHVFWETDPSLGLRSKPGESREQFAERCKVEAERRRDEEMNEAESRYLAARAPLASLVPAPPEPKPKTTSIWDLPVLNLLKASPSKIVLGPTNRAEEKRVEQAIRKLEKLDADWIAEQSRILETWNDLAIDVREVLLTPRKTDISVVRFGLAWVPFWRLTFVDGHVEWQRAHAQNS
jgi:hypothetical protein